MGLERGLAEETHSSSAQSLGLVRACHSLRKKKEPQLGLEPTSRRGGLPLLYRVGTPMSQASGMSLMESLECHSKMEGEEVEVMGCK